MLDKLDQELVIQLQKSGRESYVTPAKALKVSERTVRKRVKNLLDKGTIKITAVPALDTLGYNFTGIVALQVQLSNVRTIGEQLAKHPNVCLVVNVTGRYDLIVIIVANSSKEFADLMESFISPIPGVLRTETFVSLNTYKGENGSLDTRQLISNLGTSSRRRTQ